MELNTVWFLLIGFVIAVYAVLDGFDLGVGILSLLGRSEHRRVHMRAIGSVWDGNQVWLLTAGGAFFAAFPAVYATAFSGFYVAMFLLLAALICRAVSFEFSAHAHMAISRRIWEIVFGIASLAAAFTLGVAFGNILRGLPLDADGNYTGTIMGLFSGYAVLVGLLTVAMFMMHGAIYMTLKTDGEMRDRFAAWVKRGWLLTVILYAGASFQTYSVSPFLFDGLASKPLFYVVIVIVVTGLFAVPVCARGRRFGWAFAASAGSIAGMIALAGLSLYPILIPARPDLALSLTVHTAASSPKTLLAMLVIALIGMPLVLLYSAYMYWVFRGKVDHPDTAYSPH